MCYINKAYFFVYIHWYTHARSRTQICVFIHSFLMHNILPLGQKMEEDKKGKKKKQ